MPTNTRDPRSIITSEALGFDRRLLGTPLASPSSRLVALIIDLGVIGLLTVLTSGFTLFIWGFVALFLLRMAWLGPGKQLGQVTSVLFRGSMGCVGLIVLTVVVGVAMLRSVASDLELDGGPEEVVSGVISSTGILAAAASQALESAQDEADAQQSAREIVRAMLDVGMTEDAIVGAFDAMELENTTVVNDPGALARQVLRSMAGERPASGAEGGAEGEATVPGGGESGLSAEAASLSLAQAAERYQDGLDAGRSPADDPGMAALLARLQAELAGDSLAALAAELADEEARRARVEGELRDARAEVEAQGSGFAALLRDVWDQAGSAVGLWSVYFTLTLTLFRGYTIGKRVMGIRVIRLDGQPITWWAALERAGGYVAGIATGLLGFLQIFWDPNRQCVHDKIGGTVVVRAGASGNAAAAAAAWKPEYRPGSGSPRRAAPDAEPGAGSGAGEV